MASSGHVAFYLAFAQIEGRGVYLPPCAKHIPVTIHLCTSFYPFDKACPQDHPPPPPCTGLRSLAVSCSKSEVEQCVSSLNCLNLLTSLTLHLTATDKLVAKVAATLLHLCLFLHPQTLATILSSYSYTLIFSHPDD